jgi:hypothetical protein
MNPFAPALAIANAILYEGYVLYPYTASATKNRVRWQFGVVAPRAYAARGTGEPTEAQTEIVLEAGRDTQLDVLVRFLQIEAREVERWTGEAFEPVPSLTVGTRKHVTFEEGIEREFTLRFTCGARANVPIAFAAQERVEFLHDDDGVVLGRIVRRQWPLHGAISVESEALGALPLHKVRVRIENLSVVVPGTRSAAPRTAFVSTHTLLHARGGTFLSALDSPAEYAEVITDLANRNTWPVLVGDGTDDAHRSALVLSSPIVLYDFPAVAPQSEADTYDATEIDELMMLSVLSLSDAERDEARVTDPRARAVIERAERFGEQDLNRLHGALKVGSATIVSGSKVRLRPKRRADAWDIFLKDRLATVRAIHQDVDDEMYVAVTVDDDPASDLHEWYGRSFFFYPDEVEPA